MAARTLEALQKQYGSKKVKSGGMPPMGPGRGPGRGPGGPGMRAHGKPKNTKEAVKRLLSYLSPYRARLILVFVCMLFSTASSLVGGYILRPVINSLVGEGSAADKLANLAMILVVIGCVYFCGVVAAYLQARIMLSVSLGATEKLRNDLFNKVQNLPVRVFDGDANGEIMSRFTNDVDNIDMMLNNTVVSLISGAINILGTVCMMVYTNIWLTLITACFVPIYIFGGAAIGKASRKYYVGQQAALGAINGYIEESVSGQKVIKVFNHEKVCEEEFTHLNDDMRVKQFKAQFFGGIMGPVLGNISQIGYAVTAGVGGLLCLFGGFDVGGLAVFVQYSRHFSMPIHQISQQMATIFSALAGAERVFEL
ncbi:MAG: ABC transporter ATP-binding protein, partial [Clostridia bacterium]|nr:ABC transporter ATP-binding protein [Clostridia bacterium]